MSKILFFSGAGLSADSGLSTFRDSGGLWDKYDIDKVCNIATWIQNYELVHEFYNMRRTEYKKAEPNAMHLLIADMQKRYGKERVGIITQNVDTLLEKAGCEDVMHVHGRIDRIYCVQCLRESFIDYEFGGAVCECGCEIFKPSIVFFGEAAPMYKPMYEKISELNEHDLIVVVGTNGSVVPIDYLIGTKRLGIKARRALCNLESSEHINEENYDFVFFEKAAEAAPKIAKICEGILEKQD